MTIATLNVTTLAQLARRQLIEKWMQEHKIDILSIQETKIKNNGHEKRQKATWFFSGQDQLYKNNNNRFDTGVGIVVSNRIKRFIHKITPLNDRLMYIEMKTAIPTYRISTYAPTAEAADIHKNQYYDTLNETVRKLKKKGILYIY